MARTALHRISFALLFVGFVAALGSFVLHLDRRAYRELDARFELSAAFAEPFLGTYVDDVLARTRAVAESRLGQPMVDQAELDAAVEALGFEAAVLVDAAGHLSGVYPARPDILGREIEGRYDHLRRALATGRGVSNVVTSAADGIPAVGFATRYRAGGSQRVFSGAYEVSRTPLRAYLLNFSAANGARVDLVDRAGVVLASSRGIHAGRIRLSELDAALANAAFSAPSGRYEIDSGPQHFVTRPVAGTPWRLVMSQSEAALYAPLGGRRALAWLVFGALSTSMAALLFLLAHVLDSRERLRAINVELDHIARVDRLTDVPNRRELENQLSRLQSSSARHAVPLSALIVDIDHFKRINDQHGHAAGDQVLRDLAHRMSRGLRLEDVFGRWGGEEFMVLLPNTAEQGAAIAAERIRLAASASPVALACGERIRATVSVGCATSVLPRDPALIERADAALYEAKRSGRDRVAISARPGALN